MAARKSRLGTGLAEAAIKAGRPLVAAIYNRVSLDKVKKRKSVGEQDKENRDACRDEGWVVGRVYTDNDVSASRFSRKERPDWDLLLEDLNARRFEVLVFWESSRGDRKPIEWLMLLETCRELGVLIHVTTHDRTYDVRVPRDWKVLAEDGIDNAYESERTSLRVGRDLRANAETGRPHGPVLYGYQRQYGIDDEGHRYLAAQVFDEEPREAVGVDGTVTAYTRAGVVREAARRISGGEDGQAVADDFNRRGIPTPRNGAKGWANRTIRRMLLNPGYVGLRHYYDEPLPGVKAVWPALLDKTTYEACVARYMDPKRANTHDSSIKYLGSGLYVCGVCGIDCRVNSPNRKRKTPTLSYLCFPRRKDLVEGSSYHVGRKVSDVDDYVQRSVWLRLIRDDIKDLLAEDERADASVNEMLEQIAELQGRIDRAADECAEGRMSEAMAGRIEARLLPQIKELRAKASQARVAPVLRGFVGLGLDGVVEEWWRRSLPERREVLRALTARIEILPVGRRPPHAPPLLPEESVRIVWRQPKTG